MYFQPQRLSLGKVSSLVTPFCVCYTLQSAFESGQEATIFQIDFSAAFDYGIVGPVVSVHTILEIDFSAAFDNGISGPVLSVLT